MQSNMIKIHIPCTPPKLLLDNVSNCNSYFLSLQSGSEVTRDPAGAIASLHASPIR